MDKPIQGFFFRDFKSSYIPDILEEIYLRKIYDKFLIGKKDLFIVDIGGNIGLTSYFFKDFAREVFCIEPAKEHQEVIRTMLDYNKIKNITLCKYAIGNKTEKKKFYHNPNVTAHSLSLIANPQDFEEVDVLSLDEFMVRNKLDHIDLLKMDSEGEEAKIFTSDGFKKYAPKIKTIVGEWHEWCGVGQNQFANTLRDLGFEFNWLPSMKAAVFTAVRI